MPESPDGDRRLREFVGCIWIGDRPGIRLTVQARNVQEARGTVIAKYGQGHVITLWNEDDSRRARNAARDD